MSLYKPSELRAFLTDLGISPKKALSQNFLIDGNIIRKIVELAAVQPGDVVLEIGSGPGALTEALLAAGAHVIAVEKDVILARALERLQTEDRRLEVHCQDIIDFDLDATLRPRIGRNKVKVIANLPYHLTTPILTHLVKHFELFSSLCVMVQEEVARRFTALCATSDYGSFSVFLNFYSEPHYGFTVSRNCFFPAPKVDSAVVLLNLRIPPKVASVDAFFKMTRTGFEHRRKMLKASLRDIYSSEDVMKALSDCQLNPLARPEDLSLDNFVALFARLGSLGSLRS